MAKSMPIQIQLFGANGHREIEVQPKGGFFTRGFKGPRPNQMPSIFGDDVHLAESTPAPTPEPAPVIEPTPPTSQPSTDNALGDRLTALLKETDKFFPERHFEYPLLYDPAGRPIMAVATPDNFLACQELAQNPTDPRAWHYACKTAARRSSHHSGSMNEVIKYIVLAAHCLNHANRLESREVSREK